MANYRPTYIDYTPASEKSVYFDAPIMHIFSKKKDASVDNVDEGGDMGDTAGFVAPSPKRNSRIRSTTSLSNLQPTERPDEDDRSASAAVPGHLPPPAVSFPEPMNKAPRLTTPALLDAERGEHEDAVPAQVPQPTSRFIEDPTMASTAQERKRTGSLRSTDFASLSSPTMQSPTKSNINTLKKSNSNAKLQKRREGSVSSTTTRTDPDSGYDSPTSPKKRLSSLRKDNVLEDQEIEPVPVVWANGAQPQQAETDDEDDAGHHQYDRTPRSRSVLSHTQGDGANVRRSQSMRSYRTGRDEQGSIRTTPSRASARRKSLSGGTFANGPGTIGPNAKADEEETKLFRARSVHAEAGLTKKEKAKLGKTEIKEGKRMAKVIKQEAKIEKKVLEQSVRDLAELQKIQKYAVKEEAKTNAAYAQALKVFHKEELAFLAARAKFERAQADLQCYEDAREAARDHARDATEMLQEKNREIEWLRAQKHADDRERELKLRQLAGKAL